MTRKSEKTTDPEGDVTAQWAWFIVLTVGKHTEAAGETGLSRLVSTRPDAGMFIAAGVDTTEVFYER
jgi:hypothetical protein